MATHVGIAGAGLMGRLLACALVDEGYEVTLFDRDPINTGSAAGFTAAGMLTPYAEVESAEPIIYTLGMRSLQLWPELVKKFSPNLRYNAKGSLILAHANDASDLNQFGAHVHAKLQPSKDQFQSLSTAQITELEPELSTQFNNAFFLPEEAWVSAEDFMQCSAKYLAEKNVRWFAHTSVDSVTKNAIKTEHDTHCFDWVVDTRGTGAKPEWKDVRGVRGELIWLQAPEVTISRLVRLMHPRYRIYLVPTMHDDIYIVGATQIECDDDSPISVRSALELLSAVYSMHSGFAEARILKTATNCRPALIDNLPKTEISDGLIRINGLFRHGYLLAPAIAEQVINWLGSTYSQTPAGAGKEGNISMPNLSSILDIAI